MAVLVAGALLAAALPLLLLAYFIKHRLWWGIGGILIALVSIPVTASFVRDAIRKDFLEQCVSTAKTIVHAEQRLRTDTIYVSKPHREPLATDDYLGLSARPFNNPDYGFRFVETDEQFGYPHIKLYHNGNAYDPIDIPTSSLELSQTITRYSTKKYYSIDKSQFVLRDRVTGMILAERTILALNPVESGWVYVLALAMPRQRLCGDTLSQTDLRSSSNDIHLAWGWRALAFVRLVVDPIYSPKQAASN